MASAVEKFRSALNEHEIDPAIVEEIMGEFALITDRDKKEKKVQFFVQAMRKMDELVDFDTRVAVRDACACCTGGWREKAVKKIAKEYEGKSVEEKLQALWGVKHMGRPVMNEDGTITAGIGGEQGCSCACSIFSGAGGKQPTEPVSPTYCFCCAGHFRYHYQIALGKKVKTKKILSTSLESCGQKPCRFVYEIVECEG